MSDSLSLGLGIQFDSTTLNQLNQILTFVKKIQSQFDGMGNPTKKTQQDVAALNTKFQELGLATAKVVKEVENVGKSITKTMDMGHGKLAQVTKDMDGNIGNIKLMNNGFQDMGATIAKNISKFAEWTFAAGALFTVVNGIKDAFNTITKFETSGIHVQRVLPVNSDMSVINKGAEDIAQRYGADLNSVMEAEESWARKLKDVNEIVQMTDNSMKLVAVTDIDLESSFKDLAAITQQFGLSSSYAAHEVDALNEMSNNMRTTSTDVAEGLAKMGSSAKMMGLDFDHATALVAAGVEATGASGSTIGTALNRMLSRLHSGAAVSQLKNVGINAFDPNAGKILDELGSKWQTLTTIQQENIAKSLGGVVQWQKLAAILGNYNRVVEATALSYNSLGSAQREIDMDLSTFQKKVDQLNASWQVFVVTIGSGSLPILKNLIDGLRLIIQSGLGIIPVLGAMATAFWGTNAALAAMGTTLTLSTGWLGLIALAVGGAIALFVGWANSANKVADANERINQTVNEIKNPHDDLLKSYTSLNNQLKNLTPSTEQYNKTQQLLQDNMNRIAKQFPQVVTAYDNIGNARKIDLGLLQQLIDKEDELMRKRNQEAKQGERDVVNNQIKSTWDKVKNAQQMIKSFTDQGEKAYVKQVTPLMFGTKDPEAAARQSYKDNLYKWNEVLRLSNAELQKLHDKRNDIDGIKSKTSSNASTIPPLVLPNMGDIPDPEGESKEKKIQKIITAYNNEIAEIDSLSKMYKSLGIEYDSIKPKIEAANSAMTSVGKLDSYNKFIADTAKSIAIWKPQEIMVQLAEKLKGIDIEFEATGDGVKKYTDLIKALTEASKELGTASSNSADKIAELNNETQNAKEQLVYQNWLKAGKFQNKNTVGDAGDNLPILKQADLTKTALDALSSSLANLGGVAGNLASSLASSMSQNFSKDGSFNWKQIGEDMRGSMMSQGINMAFQGITQMLSGDRKSNKMEDSGYSVSDLFKNFKSYDDNLKEYNSLRKQQGMDEAVGGGAMIAGAIIGGPVGIILGVIGAIFGSMGESLQDKINSLGNQLNATWQKIKEALGTSVEDIANALGNAFQANNYSDFLNNWNKSLYQITRDSLVKAFMASEAFAPLYKNLSDTITASVLDGYLSSSEILAIKNAGNAVGSSMQVLYQALGLLDNSGLGGSGSNSGSGQASYTAGSTSSIVNNTYVNIYGTYFGEDPDGLREFSLMVAREINAENSRA